MLLHYLRKADQAKYVTINRIPENNIPNIIHHTLNIDWQILIIFGKIFPTQLAIK